MSTSTPDELNEIWNQIEAGTWSSNQLVIAPRKISSEPGTDIMSVPNVEGTKADVYERKDGGMWRKCPYVGES